jgi:Protein of unknown function (DUF1592)/Protein of unknown function (DUF1588)/Protein of unknown function (DUF1595)/Protein of unknown function (DUF1585)/Protein of unknown function (DUF1587)
MPLRRLTIREYNNTVHDLLGDTTQPANAFPPDDTTILVFPTAPLLDSVRTSHLADAAAALAAAVDVTQLGIGKPATDPEQTVLNAFFSTFGPRIYRRPVLPAERTLLTALYQSGRTNEGLDVTGGIRLLIEAMLQSGAFLYHWELGPQAPQMEGSEARLGSYEMASRLSYFIWGSMPDATLLAAAAANKLQAPDDITAQATRMLADPRSRQSVTMFFDEWLGIDQLASRTKNTTVYAQFLDPLKASMQAELESEILAVALDGDGSLATLFTGTSATVTQPVAAIYGLKNVTGTTAQKVTLDSTQRAGILTRAGWQALFGGSDGSDPIKRGVAIFRRVLCGTVPDPPPDVPPPKPASAGGTTRQRFAEHAAQACASGCHGLFDDFGFAFENYDGIGQYRTMDNGLPVDATGSVTLDGTTVSFANGIDLSKQIANSQQATQCFASQTATFAVGRPLQDADQASIQAAVTAYKSAANGFRDLVVSLASSRTFRYRTPTAGEVLQ